ncbi:MAG TPA: aldehyde dehydrogenase family protein, partial [Nitrospiria bacterium]|nr:aldehyde dehydrogenase family protein [Nitrospiria bacterium]
KPAPQAPITALLLGEVAAATDLPPGALSIVPCGNDQAEQMVRSDVFKMLSFTGSVPVGWRLKAISGKKKVALELGGNAGVIIHSDTDLEYAARRCAVGGFSYSGQTCISVQRIYVQEDAMPAFLDKFIPLVKKLKTGDPASEKTNVGPLIDQGALERIEKWVEEAKNTGGEVLTGGSRDGRFFLPTVMTKVTKGMKVCSEEVFAPLVTVSPYRTFDEAVREVNESNFGLQAGIFTNDMKNMFHAFEELEVGGVMVNEVPTYRIDPMPYGGVKDSGMGREGARYAIEEMTEPRLLAINP